MLDVAARIQESGGSAQALVADISRSAMHVERVIAAAVGVGGGLDLLVNNAGRWTQSPVTDGWEKALSDWDLIMDTNLKGVGDVRSGLHSPSDCPRGGGNIINVSTYYVLPARGNGTNPPGTDLYASSKWAMNGLTQAWSQKLAEHGIRVNALCMGATDAPMLREPLRRRSARRLRRDVDDTTPDRRPGGRHHPRGPGGPHRRERRRLGGRPGRGRPAQATARGDRRVAGGVGRGTMLSDPR